MLCDIDGQPIPAYLQAMLDQLKAGPVMANTGDVNRVINALRGLQALGFTIKSRLNKQGRTEYYLGEP